VQGRLSAVGLVGKENYEQITEILATTWFSQNGTGHYGMGYEKGCR